MELKDLVGTRQFSGIEYGNEKYETWCGSEDDRQYIIFILDGVKYLASENPDDGYRSMCNELEVAEREVKNTFPAQTVLCRMKPNSDYEINDVLEVLNCSTGEVIFQIGTMNTDDYYPWFEFEYHPENMEINQ